MIERRRFITQKAVIRYQDNGVLLSDIHLTAAVMNLSGADCLQAIPEENSSRFLFFIKGNPEKFKKIINDFYSANIDGLGEKLKKFVSTVAYLKTILDKSKENH